MLSKLLIFLLLLLFSCSQSPAQVEYKNTGISNYIAVKAGDTLYSISKRYNLEISNIIEANNLTKPYILYSGQKLKYPKANLHIVKAGETLFSISKKYNNSIEKIASFNGIAKPYNISINQQIRIPDGNFEPEIQQNFSDAETKISSFETINATDKNDESYIKIEPVSDPEEVLNNSNDFEIIEDEVEEINIIPVAKPIDDKPFTVFPEPVKNENIFQEDIEAVKKNLTKADISRVGKYGFIWPLQGKIISRFGPRKGGLYNDGINIKASKGSSVFAANDGTVVYSKSKLKDYGNMVLLKHDNGYITSYAHNDKLLVKEGDKVEKGQVIATVGDSGQVTIPQLHFTIRKGKLAVNPQSYLPNS